MANPCAKLVYFVISILCLVISISFAVKSHIRKEKHTLTNLQFIGIGIALALLFLLMPVHLQELTDPKIKQVTGKDLCWVYAVCSSLHHTMRCFILDGEFDFIKESIVPTYSSVCRGLWIAYYAGFLFVGAPVLTFGFIVSLFKDSVQRIRLKFTCDNLFIFSELNSYSLTLAKSIRDTVKKAHIVFTDVYAQMNESEFELLEKARALSAIILKEDISNLRLHRKKNKRIEYFLIGKDEAENISQTEKLVKQYTEVDNNGKHHGKTNLEKKKIGRMSNKKIFCFATAPGSEYILDSLDKGIAECGEELLEKRFSEKGKKASWNTRTEKDGGSDPSACTIDSEELYNQAGYLRVRRISIPEVISYETISSMNIFRDIKISEGKKAAVSILLVGMGVHGIEMLRTLLWYSQVPVCHVEITVIDDSDIRKNSPGWLESRLAYEFPEIMKYNHQTKNGDHDYDLQIFGNIDIHTNAFERELMNGDYRDRLQRVRNILVMTGDDNQNIATAVYLRALYDRIAPPEKETSPDGTKYIEKVRIGAIVYDLQNVENYKKSNDTDLQGLFCYDGTPYHIDIYGDASTIYQYGTIFNQELEKQAFAYHMGWANIQAGQDLVTDHANYRIELAKEEDRKAYLKNWTKFENVEYYRRSSLASALYWRELGKKPLSDFYRGSDETIINERRNEAEHLRWNAYMRTYGYVYHENRFNRAKCHYDLRSLKEIDQREIEKDKRQQKATAGE